MRLASFPGSCVWDGNESGVRLASFPGSYVWDGNESGVRLAFSPTYIHQDVLIFSVEGIYPLEGWHHQSRTQSV